VSTLPQGAAGAMSFYDPLEGTEIRKFMDLPVWEVAWSEPLLPACRSGQIR
jgi:hypothetical protein